MSRINSNRLLEFTGATESNVNEQNIKRFNKKKIKFVKNIQNVTHNPFYLPQVYIDILVIFLFLEVYN